MEEKKKSRLILYNFFSRLCPTKQYFSLSLKKKSSISPHISSNKKSLAKKMSYPDPLDFLRILIFYFIYILYFISQLFEIVIERNTRTNIFLNIQNYTSHTFFIRKIQILLFHFHFFSSSLVNLLFLTHSSSSVKIHTSFIMFI